MRYRYSPMPTPCYQRYGNSDRFVYDVIETEDWLDVFLKSTPHAVPCPDCGVFTDDIAATYERTVVDIPWKRKLTMLHLNVYKYACQNRDCPRTIFAEDLDFIAPLQQRTDACNVLILAVTGVMSTDAAVHVLGKLNIDISHVGILRLIRRVTIVDLPDRDIASLPEVADLNLSQFCTALCIRRGNVIHLMALLRKWKGATILSRLQGNRRLQGVPRKRLNELSAEIMDRLDSWTEDCPRLFLYERFLENIEVMTDAIVPFQESLLDETPQAEEEERDAGAV